MEPERWTWPESLDALQAAPESHRLRFENDAVRCPRNQDRTGPDDTGAHSSLAGHSLPPLDRPLRASRRWGAILVDTRSGGFLPKPASAIWGDALPPHTLENVDASEIHIIGVELKRS